jgi:hypothetical protein
MTDCVNMRDVPPNGGTSGGVRLERPIAVKLTLKNNLYL